MRLRCGVPPAAKIVIGLSGGADSVALLLACLTLQERAEQEASPVHLAAVHVHHHLRGRSADDDADFAAELCRRFGVTLRTEHVRPGTRSGNVAENARELRYDALHRVARQLGAPFIAVGHHADDQFETILIALCRGAGVEGLAGMPWTRPLGEGVSLVRPLLAVRRSDCEDFCRAAGVTWRDDPSNADPKNLRARLRRDVLPLLEELWPDAPARAAAGADAVDAARVTLNARLEETFGPATRRQWSREALACLPLPVIAAGLRRAALDAAPGLSDAFGRRLLLPAAEAIVSGDEKPRRFDWPGGLVLRVTKRQARIDRRDDRD